MYTVKCGVCVKSVHAYGDAACRGWGVEERAVKTKGESPDNDFP